MLKLKSPLDLLFEEDLKIIDEAKDLITGGIAETEGTALKAAISRILQSQSKLANLKGMLLYTLALKKAEKDRLWFTINDQYKGNTKRGDIDGIIEHDPKYMDMKGEISQIEALLPTIEDLLWSLRSMMKYYNI